MTTERNNPIEQPSDKIQVLQSDVPVITDDEAIKSNSFAEKQEALFFSRLEKSGVSISDDHRQSIQRRIHEISNYTPRVGVFGKTGVGKSSLCNALFGQDICSISDVHACTRDPQEVLLTIGDSGQSIILLDVPGVGEDRERDKEYDELYKSLLPELDLIFWVFKGDDRAYASDEDFYKRLIKPYAKNGKPFIAVINQVDKIEPFREWDEKNNLPGNKQILNIKDKRDHIARFLELPVAQVVPVSANERYGLMELVDSIVHTLPDEKKSIVLHSIETADEIRKKAAEEAEERARKEVEEARYQAEEAKRKLEEMTRKTAETKRQSEEAHQRALAEEREKRQRLDWEAAEREDRRCLAEKVAMEEREKARLTQDAKAAEAAEAARKEVEDARKQAEEAKRKVEEMARQTAEAKRQSEETHQRALVEEREKRQRLEREMVEHEEKLRRAEEVATAERERARRTRDEVVISSETRETADRSFWGVVLDVVGGAIKSVVSGAKEFFKGLFR